jgi:hypothetical protein
MKNQANIISCRIPEYWAHAAQSFGLTENDSWGHEGTRAQFQALAAALAGMDRSVMPRGLKGSHTNVSNLVTGALR